MNDAQQSINQQSGESSAAVLGSNLLAFFPGLSREDKQYIKDSMRWAQFQADLRHDRRREPVQWFEFYSGGFGLSVGGWSTNP